MQSSLVFKLEVLVLKVTDMCVVFYTSLHYWQWMFLLLLLIICYYIIVYTFSLNIFKGLKLWKNKFYLIFWSWNHNSKLPLQPNAELPAQWQIKIVPKNPIANIKTQNMPLLYLKYMFYSHCYALRIISAWKSLYRSNHKHSLFS